jgi:large subunit ribosomal protein L35
MPKMRSHRGAAKRFRVTKSGKVLHRKANRSHLLGKKTSRRKRRLAQKSSVGAERKNILRLLGRR